MHIWNAVYRLLFVHIFLLTKSLVYDIISNVASKTALRGSGGTGRRARLRGVWFTPYGFKSRLPHQRKKP